MSSQERESSWVPDYVPNFGEREFAFTIPDKEIAAGVIMVSQLHGEMPIEVGRRIISIGLIIAKTDSEKELSIIETGVDGEEKIVHLMDSLGPVEGTDPTIIGGRISLNIPGVIADEFMAIANAHQTTMDEVLEQMFKWGIRMAAGERDQRRYIFKDGNKGSESEVVFK